MTTQHALEMILSAIAYLRLEPINHENSYSPEAIEVLEDAGLNLIAGAEAMDDPLLMGRANTYAGKWSEVST